MTKSKKHKVVNDRNNKGAKAIMKRRDYFTLHTHVSKIHGMWYSNATGRLLATLYEKEIEFELVPVDIMKGEQKNPTFLAMQPFGQIPVLEDEDLKLYDKGTRLYGTTPKDRAMVEQWLEIESQECTGPMLDLVNQVLFGPLFHGKAPDASTVKALSEKLGKVLDVYEAQLSKSQYLAGDFVSLADIAHLPVCTYYFNIAMQHELLNTRKYVTGWWQAISSRPSWKKIVEMATPDIESWKKNMK